MLVLFQRQKAERKYVRELMNRYRNKPWFMMQALVRLEMTEVHVNDGGLLVPRREGGKGTQVDTLQRVDNLGEMDDVCTLKRNFYRSLECSLSRIESDTGVHYGSGFRN